MHATISEDMFVKLAGQIGVVGFRRHANGSSWMLPDGRIVSEMWDGKTWQYRLAEVR